MLTDVNISKVPVAPEFVRFQEEFRQKFLITIDTAKSCITDTAIW